MTTMANTLLGSELVTELEWRTAAPRLKAGEPIKIEEEQKDVIPSSSR